MTQHNENTMSRIDARIPLSVRDTIDRAAAMQGRTRTDFLIEAALKKAEKVITEQTVIRLAMQDQEMLANALLKEKVTKLRHFSRIWPLSMLRGWVRNDQEKASQGANQLCHRRWHNWEEPRRSGVGVCPAFTVGSRHL